MANPLLNTTPASPGLNIPTPGQPMANIGIPPNMSVLAAMSAGLMPANAYTTNEGVGNNVTVASALGTGSDGGNASSPVNGVPFGSGAQAPNSDKQIGVAGDVQLAAQAPAANVTFQGGTAATQYAG